MTKLEPRTPHGVTSPVYRHSGSFTPAPTGVSDGNAGGQITPSQYSTPMSPHALPIKNGGQG
jgi:hypothetical protein